MGVEMVAFSNTQGGMLIVGVDDKTGIISSLSFEEIQQSNTLSTVVFKLYDSITSCNP